ncbi:MAG: TorD/DmsD family molecular chaperone [Ramlibacter sp.]
MDARVVRMPELESQAVALDLLRQAFLHGPTMGLIEAISSVRPHQLDVAPEAGAAFGQLVELVKGNRHRLPAWLEDIQVEYTRLFIGPQEPPVLLYASCHLLPTRSVMSEETLAVRDAYGKSGLVVERLNSLPDDHLGVELEFLFALTRAAADSDDATEAMRLVAGRSEFIRRHLAPWAGQVADEISKESQDPFFRALASLLRSFSKG